MDTPLVSPPPQTERKLPPISEQQAQELFVAAVRVLGLRMIHGDDWDSCPLCRSVQPWHLELADTGEICPLQGVYEAIEHILGRVPYAAGSSKLVQKQAAQS